MKTSSIAILALAFTSAVTVSSCKKDDDNNETEAAEVTQQDIIDDMAANVNASTYTQLAVKGSDLYNAVLAFNATPSAAALNECRTIWKSARSTWEQSEGFLYGPVASENIDPRIDTWPVDFNALDAQLAGSNQFTDSYIDGLDDALKGFHPIEYLLFGLDGNKQFTDFTAREKDYLAALAKNLKTLTTQLSDQWQANVNGSYYSFFTAPGSSNPYYPTSKSVYEEMVNAVIGICDEVANGKISEPYLAQDPSLEESPYSQNSIRDFTDNIRSVQNVYLGKFNADGNGLEDLVRKHNLSLDNTIKTKINTAISALNNVTDPFGQAISTQQVQVQASIDAITDLKATLENDLLPFVQQYVTE
jgi:putative iron-regulated protein